MRVRSWYTTILIIAVTSAVAGVSLSQNAQNNPKPNEPMTKGEIQLPKREAARPRGTLVRISDDQQFDREVQLDVARRLADRPVPEDVVQYYSPVFDSGDYRFEQWFFQIVSATKNKADDTITAVATVRPLIFTKDGNAAFLALAVIVEETYEIRDGRLNVISDPKADKLPGYGIIIE